MESKRRWNVFVALCLVGVMLCACAVTPNQNSSPTETQLQQNDTGESTNPTDEKDTIVVHPDTVLEVETVDLQALKSEHGPSYVLIETDGDSSKIYRIYMHKRPDATMETRIQYLETKKVTAGFAQDEAVRVKTACENIINEYDYHLFDVRFGVLRETDSVNTTDIPWNENVHILLSPETGEWIDLSALTVGLTASDVEAGDMGMVQFMYLMYRDRGIGMHGTQHFLT